jgi:hypothetical protein
MKWTPVIAVLIGLSCGDGKDGEIVEFCDRTSVQDGSLGRSFLLNYCTVCHSSQVTGEARNGAPAELNFETLTGLSAHADRVLARTQDETMPPGGGVDADDFLKWLDCGAPGEETPLPIGEPASSGEAFEVAVFVDNDAGALLLTRKIEIGSRGPFPNSPWSMSSMDVTQDQAWLWSEVLFAEDGSILWAVEFIDGLLIVDGDQEAWTETVEVLLLEDGLEVNEEWTVHLSKGPGLPLDGRELTGSPTVVSAQVEGGPEWAWHLAGTVAPVAQSVWLDAERSWTSIRINANDFLEVGAALPITPGQVWIERTIVPGGWSL